jgi:peptide/nickel transport system ATP-binding protein
MAYLEIQNLSVTYSQGGVHAVRDCSLQLNRGETLGIVGESGSGKSTLALALLRMFSPKTAEITGSILLEGREVLNLPHKEFDKIRWQEMAMVFQKSMNSFSPVHRLGRQLENIWRVHEPKAPRKEIREKLIKLFEICNLKPEVYRMYPFELSGGMLQRVSIVMALMHNPGVLILDEATTALDVLTQQQIMAELKQLQKRFQFSLLVISHDLSVISKLCDRVAVMYCGRVLETGLTAEVLHRPRHPYTKALIESYPRLDSTRGTLRGIPGSLPDMSKPIAGCVFADRCRYCQADCRLAALETELSDSRSIACCHWRELP